MLLSCKFFFQSMVSPYFLSLQHSSRAFNSRFTFTIPICLLVLQSSLSVMVKIQCCPADLPSICRKGSLGRSISIESLWGMDSNYAIALKTKLTLKYTKLTNTI